MTPANEQQAHEFEPHEPCSGNGNHCTYKDDEGFSCLQPRSAAIHRLPSDTEGEDSDTASLANDDNPIVGGECCTEDEPETTAQDAPPDVIWIDPVAPSRMYWVELYKPLAEHLISYTRTSTTEGLHKALRTAQVVMRRNSMLAGSLEMKQVNEALAKHEGKGQS